MISNFDDAELKHKLLPNNTPPSSSTSSPSGRALLFVNGKCLDLLQVLLEPKKKSIRFSQTYYNVSAVVCFLIRSPHTPEEADRSNTSSANDTTTIMAAPAAPTTSMKEGVTKLPKEIRNVVAGGVAGMVAKTVVAPLERIKILYQVSAEQFALRQVPVVAMNIIRTEGFAALWRGNTATMLRVFPYSGIQFMVFDRCKTYSLKLHERRESGLGMKRRNTEETFKSFGLTPIESLVSGMIAGTVSVLCTYPLDLTRAQMAMQHKRRQHSKKIVGFIGVLKHNHGLGVSRQERACTHSIYTF